MCVLYVVEGDWQEAEEVVVSTSIVSTNVFWGMAWVLSQWPRCTCDVSAFKQNEWIVHDADPYGGKLYPVKESAKMYFLAQFSVACPAE